MPLLQFRRLRIAPRDHPAWWHISFSCFSPLNGPEGSGTRPSKSKPGRGKQVVGGQEDLFGAKVFYAVTEMQQFTLSSWQVRAPTKVFSPKSANCARLPRQRIESNPAMLVSSGIWLFRG